MSASASKKKRKELDEQGLSPKALATQQAKEKQKKTLRNVLITVLCVVVAAAIVFAVISLVNRPSYDTKAAAATVGDEKITVPVYDIFYNTNATSIYNTYNSYKSIFGEVIAPNKAVSQQTNPFTGTGTLEDYFKESAADTIQTYYNYYIQAKADGYELTKEQKDSISEEIDNIKTAAESYGYPNVNSFLERYYGEGCTLSAYKTYLEVSNYYSGYLTKLQEEFKPSAEELQAAYDKDPDSYDLVSYTYAASNAESTTVPVADSEPAEGEDSEGAGDSEDAGEEEATTPTTTVYTDKAKADAKALAESYLTEMPEDAYTGSYNKANAANVLNQEIADWLFDAERKEGDTKVFTMNEDETSYYTVRFDGRETNDYCRINANIITITKDKEDAELEEGQQTSKEKFEALVAAIKDGMTDEDFSTAVSALGYTASTTSIQKSYSNEEIRTWLYDTNRKAGDLLTRVETDTTFYVVRYVSTDEMTYRDAMVKDTLWSEKTEAIATTNKIELVEDMLQYANTDLIFYESSSES